VWRTGRGSRQQRADTPERTRLLNTRFLQSSPDDRMLDAFYFAMLPKIQWQLER